VEGATGDGIALREPEREWCFAAFAILYKVVFVVIAGRATNNKDNINNDIGSIDEYVTFEVNYNLIILKMA
jgi:hypothetical protein